MFINHSFLAKIASEQTPKNKNFLACISYAKK